MKHTPKLSAVLWRSLVAALAAALFVSMEAWAVYRQPVDLVTESGEEIPRKSISFTTPSGAEVPVEEDEDNPNRVWLVFPGDEGEEGKLEIGLGEDGETSEIDVPKGDDGRPIEVNIDTLIAILVPAVSLIEDVPDTELPEDSSITEDPEITEESEVTEETTTEETEVTEETEGVEETEVTEEETVTETEEPVSEETENGVETEGTETSVEDGPYVHDISENLQPINVGPREQVGTKSAGRKVLEGAAGAALGSLLGGRGNRSSSRSSEPRTKRDPTRKLDFIEGAHAETEGVVGIRGMWDKKGNLLISTEIDKSKDKGTFQYVYLVDEDGRQMGPSELIIYKLWRKVKLTVSWTKSTYVDGALVSRSSGGWSRSWTEALGLFTRGADAEGERPPGFWQLAGYGRAHAGLRRVGTVFDVTQETFGDLGNVHVIVHVTRPSQDPVMTAPYGFSMSLDETGNPVFTALSPAA